MVARVGSCYQSGCSLYYARNGSIVCEVGFSHGTLFARLFSGRSVRERVFASSFVRSGRGRSRPWCVRTSHFRERVASGLSSQFQRTTQVHVGVRERIVAYVRDNTTPAVRDQVTRHYCSPHSRSVHVRWGDAHSARTMQHCDAQCAYDKQAGGRFRRHFSVMATDRPARRRSLGWLACSRGYCVAGTCKSGRAKSYSAGPNTPLELLGPRCSQELASTCMLSCLSGAGGVPLFADTSKKPRCPIQSGRQRQSRRGLPSHSQVRCGRNLARLRRSSCCQQLSTKFEPWLQTVLESRSTCT